MRLLIRDGTLLTLDAQDRLIPRGYVLLDGERIAHVGEGEPPAEVQADRLLDARNRLVLPGLVNCHLHSHENFNRGRVDNLPHNVWMIYARPPFQAATRTPEDVYLRTMLGCLEMVRSGVTLAVDDVVHVPATDLGAVEVVMRAYEDAGLRAVVTATTVDQPYHRTLPWAREVFPAELQREFMERPRPSIGELVSFARRCLERWSGPGRVRLALSPSAPQRCSRELLEALRDLQRDSGAPLVIHVLETRLQVVTDHLFYGKSAVAYLDQLGLLCQNTALVHAVWVDAEDISRIAAGGSTVWHNPSSNLKLGSGIAPVRAMLQARVPVGLGTDGMGSNDCQNLFEEMRLAALTSKITSPRYEEWLTASEVLRMATRGGLAALGLDRDLGTIEPGRLADLVLLDLTAVPFAPRHDLVRQVVYAERGASVRTVVVGGRIVMEEGTIRTVDEPKLLTAIREAAERARVAGEAGWRRSKELEPHFAEIYRRATREPVSVPPRVLWGEP
ncbi:MAG: amidohydrolase [Candidatus Rokubacteria bacterium]|nr:amidohydrolase [Candidatus Rokubacteria bacterium]